MRGALWVPGGATVSGRILPALNALWIGALVSVLAGAVLLWLTGAWVLPGGSDAHFMRVRRCLGDGFRGAECRFLRKRQVDRTE